MYDAAGQLAAEYGVTLQATGRQYVTVDHLGSTRVVTDASKTPVSLRDYEPFGGEIAATEQNHRVEVPAYSNDGGMRVKFTGKERDAESGLDYFGARYFSAAQGRFTTPDEWQGGIVDAFTGLETEQPGPLPYADITDPQTLNKYAYVRNNPLRYVDPDGHCPWCIGGLVGGGMDIGIQLLEGKSFSHLNWTSVPTVLIPQERLYSAYAMSCLASNQPIMTRQMFGRKLKRLRPDLQEAQRVLDGRKQWVYLVIVLRGEETAEGTIRSI